MTVAEYKRLLAHVAHNKRDYAIIQLLLQTGIKLSGLIRLTVRDIELPSCLFPDVKETEYLKIKGGERQEERVITINYQASQALDLYLKSRPESSSVLFLNLFGKPLGPRGVEKVFKGYYLQAGIGGATVQSLRHTFGAHHAAKGTSLKTIQSVMGHKDIRSTSIYLFLADDIGKKELRENAL